MHIFISLFLFFTYIYIHHIKVHINIHIQLYSYMILLKRVALQHRLAFKGAFEGERLYQVPCGIISNF